MSRYPFNANRTPMRLYLTRVGIVPHYAKVEMQKSLRLKKTTPPEGNIQTDIISEMPEHSMGIVEKKERPVATIGGINANVPFIRLITKEEEEEIRKSVNEMYTFHVKKLKKSFVMMPPPPIIGAESKAVQLYRTPVLHKSNELIYGSCTVQMLTQIAIFIYETFLGEYEKLHKMFTAQPPLRTAEIFEQLSIIDIKVTAMQVAKSALQEKHRLLTNQLQLYDIQRMDGSNPPDESKEIQEVRTTWTHVFHMLDLYTKGDLQ